MANSMEETTKREVETITSLYQLMCRAMIAKDLKTLDHIHDESFVLVHMTGSKMNKKEYIDAIRDGVLNYYSADLEEIDIKVNSDQAVLRGKSRVNAAVYGGGRHTWRLQMDMKLKKTGNGWKLTFSKASTY